MRPAIRICMIQNRWRPHSYLLNARPVGFLPHVKVVIRAVGPCLIRRRDTSQSALRLVLSDRMYQLTPTATASMAARSHHEPNISTMQCSEVSHNSDNEIRMLHYTGACVFLCNGYILHVKSHPSAARQAALRKAFRLQRQHTWLPGFTSAEVVMTLSEPSKSSAESIMPWLSMPFSLRGAKLAMKQTRLPTRSSGL